MRRARNINPGLSFRIEHTAQYGPRVRGVNVNTVDPLRHKYAFFQEIDFGKLKEMELEPPHVPELRSATDMSYFDDPTVEPAFLSELVIGSRPKPHTSQSTSPIDRSSPRSSTSPSTTTASTRGTSISER